MLSESEYKSFQITDAVKCEHEINFDSLSKEKSTDILRTIFFNNDLRKYFLLIKKNIQCVGVRTTRFCTYVNLFMYYTVRRIEILVTDFSYSIFKAPSFAWTQKVI